MCSVPCMLGLRIVATLRQIVEHKPAAKFGGRFF